jgi:carbonic anhydrase/acetyltransferase-like protein (isoleucine patch superfamily)
MASFFRYAFDPMEILLRLETAARRRRQRHTPRVSLESSADVHETVVFDTDTKGTITIGKGVELREGVILAAYGGSIVLEENVFVGPYCVLYGHGGLIIGRETLIAAHTVAIPSNHCIESPDLLISQQGSINKGIRIGENCWLGSGVRILDGASIGPHSVIGAGAVVNSTIPELSIAVGVPAKVIRSRQSSASENPVDKHGEKFTCTLHQ